MFMHSGCMFGVSYEHESLCNMYKEIVSCSVYIRIVVLVTRGRRRVVGTVGVGIGLVGGGRRVAVSGRQWVNGWMAACGLPPFVLFFRGGS